MATPHDFELGILPERRINWRTLVASYGLVCLFILLLLCVGLIFPDRLILHQRYTVTELIPVPSLKPEEPKPVVPPPAPKLVTPIPVKEAKLFVPRETPQPPKPEKLPDVQPPKLQAKMTPPELVPAVAIKIPKVVMTGSFGSSAPATLSAPVEKVQTGGFGAPDGLKGDGKDNAHLQVARVGGFDLPEGAGKGNGTGGAKGLQGTVASAGFGNGIAQPVIARSASVQAAGFVSQQVTHNAVKTSESGPATNAVEVTYKPNPVYTEEARQLKLEGEVLLEVVFGADGQLHVNRVVRGLGHGLDEAAIAAANKMKFKPALRNGTPVDSTAVVHVLFQLAY